MALAKLSAPVGQAPRTSSGAKVLNKSADVALVQTMLKANGFPTPTSGKINAGLIKAIGAAAKKLTGAKEPDFVVDPGGKLVKAMAAKYSAHVKEMENTRFYRLPGYNNIIVPEKEYKKIQARILKDLMKICEIHERFYQGLERDYTRMLEAGAMHDGVLKAISIAVILSTRSIKPPSQALKKSAAKQVKFLRKAIAAKDFRIIPVAMERTESSLEIFYNDLIRYNSELKLGAKQVGTVLTVTTCVGWTVVGAMAAPAIATASGLSAGSAGVFGAATSGFGVGAMQSAANEIGGHLSGTGKSAFGTISTVMIDGSLSAATGAVGKGLPDAFQKALANKLSGQVAAKLTRLTGQKATDLTINFLSRGGAEAGTEAISKAMQMGVKSAKAGKAPTQKDMEAASADILFKFMTGSVLKSLETFDKKLGDKTNDVVIKKMAPAWFKKNGRVEVPKEVREEITKTLAGKVKEQGAKYAFDAVLPQIKGTEKPDALLKKAEAELLKSSNFQAIVDKTIRDELKRRKIPLK